MKVLIVEDNERVAHFLQRGLHDAGHSAEHAGNAIDGMALATGKVYDAIIMDRMLPDGIDGISLIEELRGGGNTTPILILSALSVVDDRVSGLKSGGDDYLVKPFAFSELLARLDALARRSQHGHMRDANLTQLTLGDLSMNLLTRKVTRGDRTVTLQAREFRLLEYLMRHADQVVTRTMLFESVWNFHFEPQSNVVDVQISKLRNKISGDAAPTLRTIRNVGYILSSEDD